MDEVRKIVGSLKWEHYFQVRGHDLDGLIDMMRYDRATPNSSADTSAMIKLQHNDRLATPGSSLDNVVLTMKSFQETKTWSPTVDRWRTLGWPVLSNQVWEPDPEEESEFEAAKEWLRVTWNMEAYAEGLVERHRKEPDLNIHDILSEARRDPTLKLVCRLRHLNMDTHLQTWREWMVGLMVKEDRVLRCDDRASDRRLAATEARLKKSS